MMRILERIKISSLPSKHQLYMLQYLSQNQGCHVGSIMHKFLGVNAASTNSVTPLCTDCGGSMVFSS
ncbi:hypothetical protein CFP56_037031 [Quercus suber]|uniref:Uncharacterized protein n=1 Tax=Quercus suber TaxID=58331 RepID=A0AAW0J5R9_QUESU